MQGNQRCEGGGDCASTTGVVNRSLGTGRCGVCREYEELLVAGCELRKAREERREGCAAGEGALGQFLEGCS